MFPDLFAYNPASHLIWWVAGLLFALLGVRHRHHHRVEAYRRTWHEGRPNEPVG